MLGTSLLSLGPRSVRAEAQARGVLEAMSKGRALASSIERSYERLPGFRLHFMHRGFEWQQRGHIDFARNRLSVTWNGSGTAVIDSKTTRTFDRHGLLWHEDRLNGSLVFLLAAGLARVAAFEEEFLLERDEDFPLLSGQRELLVLRAKPRAAPLDRLMVVSVEARTFQVRRAQFVESGGARHRLDFMRLERR